MKVKAFESRSDELRTPFFVTSTCSVDASTSHPKTNNTTSFETRFAVAAFNACARQEATSLDLRGGFVSAIHTYTTRRKF